jgi:DNA-binding phage protein
VALTLGQFLELHADGVTASLHPDVDPARHQLVMREILQFLKAASGSEGRIAFNQLMQTIGLSSSMSNVASSAMDREHLVRTVNVERLGNNPYLLDEATLHLILAHSNVP